MAQRKGDTVTTTVLIDGKQSINELGKLELEATELRNDLKLLKKNTDEYVRANQKLSEVKKRITDMRTELGTAGMTMQQLTKYQRDLRREITNTTTKGTAGYKKLKAELLQVNRAVDKQRAEMRGLNTLWSKMSSEMKQFGVMAMGYLGFTFLTGQLNNLIRRAGEFSDSLGSVQKTTGLTAAQVDSLNASLKKIDTRTARSELLSMAKVAGKLGITAEKDVEGFVKSFDKINVALGEDLGAPEEVARKLGKILESFNVKEAYGIEDGLLKVGSAVNHLGKSSVANEGAIVEFTRRLAGIAPLAKLSIQDVMGLAAASDALGQPVEMASTAFSKLFIKMSSNAEEFAKYAKDTDGAAMSTKQFQQLIESDFNEAFFSLLRGVKDNSNGMLELSKTLGDLELDGSRIVGVLGTMANNIEFVSEQQKISNDEFEKGTSVLDEFNLMNETFGAKLEKLRKNLFAMFVNSSVVKGLEKMVGWMLKLTQQTDLYSQELASEYVELQRVTSEILRGNTPREQRVELIKQLQDKYPAYLGNIDAETLKNDELTKKLKAVNEQLINRIVIQKQQEKIDAANDKAADNRLKAIDLEREMISKMAEISLAHGLDIPEGDNVYDQASKFKQLYVAKNGQQPASLNKMMQDYYFTINTINSLNDELDELIANRDDMMLKFFNEDPPPGAGTFKTGTGLYRSKLGISTNPNDPALFKKQAPSAADSNKIDKEKALLDKFYDEVLKMREDLDIALMSKDDQEVARVEQKYLKMTERLGQFHADGLMDEQTYQDGIKLIEQQMNEELGFLYSERFRTYQEERKEAQDQLNFDLMSEKDQEIARVNAHYDKLTELAKKYNLDLVAVEKARAAAIGAVNQKTVDDNLQLQLEAISHLGDAMGGLSDFFGNINALMGGQSKALVKLQVAMGFAEVLAHHGVAIAAATKQAASTSFTPWGFAAKIALFMGAITAQIVRSKQMIKAADQASNKSTPKAETASRPPSFFFGGESGTSTLGFGDQYGDYAGYVHKDEFVTPAYVRQDPRVIDAEKTIKAAMAGYTLNVTGLPAAGGSNSSGDMMEAAVMMRESATTLQQIFTVLQEEGLAAYFGQDEFEKANKRYGRKEDTRGRGRL